MLTPISGKRVLRLRHTPSGSRGSSQQLARVNTVYTWLTACKGAAWLTKKRFLPVTVERREKSATFCRTLLPLLRKHPSNPSSLTSSSSSKACGGPAPKHPNKDVRSNETRNKRCESRKYKSFPSTSQPKKEPVSERPYRRNERVHQHERIHAVVPIWTLNRAGAEFWLV